MSRRRRGRGRCRDYGDDYNDDYDVVVTRIDDDQDVPSLTTHNDESNRVISASLKAHSLGVTRILTCVWHNKTAQSTVKRKSICARWHTYFFSLNFRLKKESSAIMTRFWKRDIAQLIGIDSHYLLVIFLRYINVSFASNVFMQPWLIHIMQQSVTNSRFSWIFPERLNVRKLTHLAVIHFRQDFELHMHLIYILNRGVIWKMESWLSLSFSLS